MTEGKLLGHIMSQEGIRIDPEHMEAIQRLSLPSNKTVAKSFFSQVNFLSRFIPDFSKIIKCIIDMMKGNASLKWNDPGKRSFKDIKEAIANAPIIYHPNYTRDFMIYYYALEHALLEILMQENKEGIQAPIAFMSMLLKGHELKYSKSEKHAYVVVKDLKNFYFYVLHSHSLVFVPNIFVKSILTQ